MVSFGYHTAMRDALTGAIDFDTDTFKVMLLGSGYTGDKNHSKRSNLTNEVTGAGYTAGGMTIVPTVTLDAANNRTTITFPAVEWPASRVTARYAVYYKSRGGAATADELVCLDDFGADVATSNTTFKLAASTIHVGTPATV